MPKQAPAVGEFYHVFNRGVDKRKVFLTPRNYERFTFLLFACNNVKPFLNSQHSYRGLTSIGNLVEPDRVELVDLICFCLMPNHFHLVLKQKIEKGIPLFMQKLLTGYTMYFNALSKRTGALFQGTYKAVHVENDGYLKHLVRYVHLNPAELKEPKWKARGIANWKSTHNFVKNYYWSSYADYLSEQRFHQILNIKLIGELLDSAQSHEEFVKSWLVKDLGYIADKIIEV